MRITKWHFEEGCWLDCRGFYSEIKVMDSKDSNIYKYPRNFSGKRILFYISKIEDIFLNVTLEYVAKIYDKTGIEIFELK